MSLSFSNHIFKFHPRTRSENKHSLGGLKTKHREIWDGISTVEWHKNMLKAWKDFRIFSRAFCEKISLKGGRKELNNKCHSIRRSKNFNSTFFPREAAMWQIFPKRRVSSGNLWWQSGSRNVNYFFYVGQKLLHLEKWILQTRCAVEMARRRRKPGISIRWMINWRLGNLPRFLEPSRHWHTAYACFAVASARDNKNLWPTIWVAK